MKFPIILTQVSNSIIKGDFYHLTLTYYLSWIIKQLA